jgi:hypothetical protein
MEYQAREREGGRDDRDGAQGSDLRVESRTPHRESPKDWASVASDWDNLKSALSEEWSRLTPEDVEGIEGNRRSLIERLQARYGWSEDESTMQLTNWLNYHGKRRFL